MTLATAFLASSANASLTARMIAGGVAPFVVTSILARYGGGRGAVSVDLGETIKAFRKSIRNDITASGESDREQTLMLSPTPN
ncbi:hypothetical protein [Metapseudomonas resinovorans]|uniref:hypothetical protein n=1 Tax=Metapseudomonas resinovorans TaxID=53412 RepID=UPI003D1C2269